MSESKPATSLYTALLAAQRAMGPVKKDASNPAFRSRYATLQSVLDTIEEPLHANGLLLVQRLQYDRIGRDGSAGDGTPILITELIHAASGEKLESVVAVACKDPNDPQKVGGALTYYRRYSLLALLNIAPEDDDGNAASKPAPAFKATQQPPRPRHPRDDGFRQVQPPDEPIGPPPGPRPALDADQVLTILREMDEGREPWHDIKRYADEQSTGRSGDDALRIHDALAAIAARRRNATPPASVAG